MTASTNDGTQKPPDTRRRRVWRSLWVTLVALAATVASILSSAVPSTEAVRLRNALLARVGDSADFSWTPASRPADFLAQRGPLPAEFVAAAQSVAAAGTTFERALALVRHLARGSAPGDPIMKDTLQTYHDIRGGHGGYCSDYTQVFNGLAAAAGIGVREWGVAFDGFGGWGHAFSEVYLPETGKWAMVDPFYTFWLRDEHSGEPLSVAEFHSRLSQTDPLRGVSVQVVVPEVYDFTSDQKLLAFYRRGSHQFYLWWGNNVFDYDRNPVVKLGATLSRSAEQLAAMAVGVHPHIRIPPEEAAGPAYQRFRHAQLRLYFSIAIAAALGLLLLAEIIWLLQRRR